MVSSIAWVPEGTADLFAASLPAIETNPLVLPNCKKQSRLRDHEALNSVADATNRSLRYCGAQSSRATERGPGFLRETPNANPSVSRQRVRPTEQGC